jgi:hypothetical protein
MMIMGPHTQEIHDRSLEPYMEMIAREELRKTRLLSAEKWDEFYSLAFSFLVFAVSPHPLYRLIDNSFFGLLERRYSAIPRTGRTLMDFIFV